MIRKIVPALFFLLLPVTGWSAGNTIDFHPGTGPNSEESKYLVKDSGSLFAIDNGPHRYADGGSTFVYKFDMKGISGDTLMIDVCHDFKVEMSFDDQEYFTVLESPEDVHNDGNRGWKVIDLKAYRKSEQTVYLRFSDRTPDNGWGSCVYEVFLGSQAKKKLSKISFKGETSILGGIIDTAGKARNMTFDREWFSYRDNGSLDRISNLYQNLKLIMSSSILDKYNLDAEFSIDKFNYAWKINKFDPILSAFDQNYVKGAFVIALEKFQDYNNRINQKVLIGKIDPEYTSYTIKKKHNGVLLDLSDGPTRLQLTGARLKSFNDTSEYLLSGRAETGSDKFKVGVTYAITRYTTKDNTAGVDLLLGNHGSAQPAIYIRISDSVQDDGFGAKVFNFTISQLNSSGIQPYDIFVPGDGTEPKYLYDVKGNYYVTPGPGYRQVAENGYIVYRFPITSDVKQLIFAMNVVGNYQIAYSYDGINYNSAKSGTSSDGSNQTTEVFTNQLLQPPSAGTNILIKIADFTTSGGWGGDLYRLDYYEDGVLKISFSPDNGPNELQYMDTDSGSIYGTGHRYADGNNYFIYKLPVSAGVKRIKVVADINHNFNMTVTLGAQSVNQHPTGYVDTSDNRQLVTFDLNSYDNIQKNGYIRTGSSIIGADFSARVFDTDIKGEFARMIDHRLYASGARQNPGFNAFTFNLDKKLMFFDTEIIADYFYVDPAYDASETVDDRYNLASGTYKKEVTTPGLDFDPLKDMNDNSLNDEDEITGKPFYLYDPDQNGYKLQVISKISKEMTTLLYADGVQEISTAKFGQKYGGKLDFIKNIRSDSSIVTRFWSFYTKDPRSISTLPEQWRNYLKFNYNFWGLKIFDFSLGVDQIELIRDYHLLQTSMDSQLAARIRGHFTLVNKLTMMPMIQLLSYRQYIVAPEYSVPQEWNQFIPGVRFEFKSKESQLFYLNYRFAYTDDIRYPVNVNYYNLFEAGFEMQGALYMQIYYRYLEQFYFDSSMSASRWHSGNLSALVKFWF